MKTKMLEWLRFGVSALFMLIGLCVYVIGVFGIFKFRFILNRMHSAAILDTMGLFFILLSLAVAKGFCAITIKGFLILLFLWLTGPVSSHLIAKMEFFTDKNLDKEINNSLKDVKGDNEDADL